MRKIIKESLVNENGHMQPPRGMDIPHMSVGPAKVEARYKDDHGDGISTDIFFGFNDPRENKINLKGHHIPQNELVGVIKDAIGAFYSVMSEELGEIERI